MSSMLLTMPAGERNAAKTHCPRGHEYSEANIYVLPSRPNARYCRICRRDHERARKARLRRERGVPQKPGYSDAERRAQHQNGKAALRSRAKVFTVTAKDYLAVQRKPCFYCGGPGGEVDHLVPLARGGDHGIGNMVPSCRRCNIKKGTKLLVEWRRGGY